MDFRIPEWIEKKLEEIDEFIAKEIKPLERQDDNIRFFDHRREHARTDWDNQGLPREEWEGLLREMRRRADAACRPALLRTESLAAPHPQKQAARPPGRRRHSDRALGIERTSLD